MPHADPIPAIPEDDATGEVADAFADLRASLGVPFVNLIWRHLATIPGALPAIWGLVKPLYGSDALETRGADLRAAATVPGVDGLPALVWNGVGLGEADRAEIVRLIEDYNRANSVNFLALATASLVLRGSASSGRGPPPRAAARTPSPDARPLPALGALPEPVREVVLLMDGFGRLGQSSAIASLYRHLGYWPAFLSMSYAALLPQERTGVFRVAQQTVVVEGRGIAERELLPLVSTDGFALDPASRDQALASLDDFTSLMIGRMTVMGTALRTLLP